MSLEYAMLGFLQHVPLSGYDMKKRIDGSIKHFWSADQSQIYRTLNRLTEDGYVEVELIQQDTRPNSKVYHITEKGRQAFFEWMTKPTPPMEARVSWLIQIFFAGQLPDEAIIFTLEQIAGGIRKQVENYKFIPGKFEYNMQDGISPREAFFRELTVDYGITLHLAMLTWLEKTIVCLKRKDHPPLQKE